MEGQENLPKKSNVPLEKIKDVLEWMNNNITWKPDIKSAQKISQWTPENISRAITLLLDGQLNNSIFETALGMAATFAIIAPQFMESFADTPLRPIPLPGSKEFEEFKKIINPDKTKNL